MAKKFDPTSFPFGANAPRNKSGKKPRKKSGGKPRSDAWRAYTGQK